MIKLLERARLRSFTECATPKRVNRGEGREENARSSNPNGSPEKFDARYD